MLLNAISWVEIPVADFDRAKKFYSRIFDYDMPEIQMNNRMGFLLFDQAAGGIGAAIVQGPGYLPGPGGAKVYLNAGKDLNTVLKRIPDAGGKVLLEKMPVSAELGFIAMFEDTEGNYLMLHSSE